MGGTPDEVPQVYHDRSPLYKAENITADLILFQGEDDKVGADPLFSYMRREVDIEFAVGWVDIGRSAWSR